MEKIWYYYVDTFRNDETFEPIFAEGEISAESAQEAVNKLVENGVIHPNGYEFLELYVKK